MRSKGPRTAAHQSPRRKAARPPTPLAAAFLRAVARASSDRSIPSPRAPGHWSSNAIRMQPDPVPRSRMVGEGTVPSRRAISTRVSVSGRGTSVPGDKAKVSPRNSHSPRIRATGSPASLRPSASVRAFAPSCPTGKWPRRARSVEVRSRIWRHRKRASPRASAIPACSSALAARRSASAREWPGSTLTLIGDTACVTPCLRPQAIQPDAP